MKKLKVLILICRCRVEVKIKFELNGKKICAGDGLNKKEAKADCAKNALAVIAPNVYAAKYC